MNPQYAQPPTFGVQPQGFVPNRASPSLGPQLSSQNFQNIPLGQPSPGPPPQSYIPATSPPGVNNNPPQSQSIGAPPPQLGQHLPPGPGRGPAGHPPPQSNSNINPSGPGNLRPPPSQMIPAGQLPPGAPQHDPQQRPASAGGQYGPPPLPTKSEGPPQELQNGPPQQQRNGPPPPQYQNGPGFGHPPPHQQGQPNQQPLPPPASISNKPPTSNLPPSVTQQGLNSHFPTPQQQQPGLNQPPITELPQNPSSHQQSPFNPPNPNQISNPPQFPGQPPLSNKPTSQNPLLPQNQISNQQSSIPGHPPPGPGAQPPQTNQSMFPNQTHAGQGPHPQPHLGGPPQLGQQNASNKFPVPPFPGQYQPPLGNQQFGPGQPPLPGQTPLLGNQPGQLPVPRQPPLPGQLSSGQPPLPGQPPLLPGQQPFNNSGPPQQPFHQGPPGGPVRGINQLPPGPGGPSQFNQVPSLSHHQQQQQQQNQYPPGPGVPPPGPNNNLANQMQRMNLGGPPRPFPPGGPMKANSMVMNGDMGPHMPPPVGQHQQQYLNGQQQRQSMRGPPGVGPGGYPPMPGVQPQPPVGGGMAGTYPQQPSYPQAAMQQAKRLDPDQMPSPIQVTQDDQQTRSGVFCTNQKGLVPPLVTTNFTVQDQGNASPRYMRSTMYNVPISQDIMKQTAVPFSLIISPMARTVGPEYPPPIVNFGDLGPVRCVRCKAYMCPYMQFIDSGRRFQCLFCKATTDVPTEYFQHLDHTGQRLDRFERPELVLGAYELIATTDYCRNNTLPKPPAIIFVIDVSYNNIKSGLVHLLCDQMKEIIQNLPVDQGHEKSNMRVGFITYNSSVHFYNIKGTLAAPQMLVVGDVQEMFMPLLDGFLCTPEESGPVIDSLMQQIPEMFGDTRETETILLPAILAGLEALKASECTGKLLVFHSTLPTAEAPGKLKNRDDRKLLSTDKERTILTPQTQAYNQLGQDCVGAGCSVDLFIFNNAYIDIATIGQVSRLTGGEVFKYTYFQADVDGERLVKDIIMDISRPIAFDAIMRVRTSTGVRPTDFYGHFFMSNTTDMEFASIDSDKAVAVEIKHDDKLSEEEGVYVQAALLYTSCSGQRRLRILNLSLKTCSQMGDLYRCCDCDSIINYLSKQAIYKLYDNSPKAVKENLINRTAQVLATYRKNCATPSSAGQLILPECMKLLPLYVNCVLKSDALSGGAEMTVDDRSFAMMAAMIMDLPASINYFYPRLLPLHELDADGISETEDGSVVLPAPIRCTVDKMNEQGVYVLENGIHMFLWIGLGASPEFVQKVFGVQSAIQVDIERTSLPELENALSVAVRKIIEQIRIERHRCMRLTMVRQREKMEAVFKHFLAEDRGNDGSASYVDFLIHMHKEIRTLLS